MWPPGAAGGKKQFPEEQTVSTVEGPVGLTDRFRFRGRLRQKLRVPIQHRIDGDIGTLYQLWAEQRIQPGVFKGEIGLVEGEELRRIEAVLEQ
nr:hypothetical protein GCM10020185_51900 [Pseudomonas brassicacearum subsp. brassicacearum]